MQSIVAFLLFVWLIGGIIFLFNVADAASKFDDKIKSTFKKVLFLLLILIISGPLAIALILIALIAVGLITGICFVVEVIGNRVIDPVWNKLKAWFTK